MSAQAFFDGQWTPDSQRLIGLRIPPGRTGIASVHSIEIATRENKELAVVKAHDREVASRPAYAPQFRPLGLSGDGRFLLLKVHEVGDLQDNKMLRDGYSSLQAVSLKDGSITMLCRFKNVSGYDWHPKIR